MLTQTKFPIVVIPAYNTAHYKMTEPTNILYCRAERNYTFIFLSEGSSFLIKVLSQDIFIRIHKSFLINVLNVKEIKGKKKLSVIMKNGETLEVSARAKKVLVNCLRTKCLYLG